MTKCDWLLLVLGVLAVGGCVRELRRLLRETAP